MANSWPGTTAIGVAGSAKVRMGGVVVSVADVVEGAVSSSLEQPTANVTARSTAAEMIRVFFTEGLLG
jgi:hypothetical protein